MKGKTKPSKDEILRLNQELGILNAINQTVNQSIDPSEILNKSLDKLTEMTRVRSAGIYLSDEKSHELNFIAYRGFSNGFIKGMKRLKPGEGTTGRVFLSGEPVFIEDYPGQKEAFPIAIEEGLKSLTVIPLRSRDKIYGTLNIAMKEFYRFTPLERDLFISIGQIIGGAMERASLYAENLKRLEEQKSLYSISQEIASRLELKVILQKIMESAVTLLDADTGNISLWDSRKQVYVVTITHGLPDSVLGKEIAPSSSGMLGEVLRRKTPILFADYEHHPHRWPELDSYHLKEVLGLPLIVREMIIGTISVGTSLPNKHFSQSEVDLLLSFAHQAAVAIGNAQLYEESLSKIKQLTALHEMGKVLSSTLDLDELLRKSLELLRDLWGYAATGIFFLDQAKNELYLKQVTGVESGLGRRSRFRVGLDGIVGQAAKTGELYYAPDVSRDPHYIAGVPDIRSEATFPLKVRDQVVGVLNVESHELNGFDQEVLKVLTSFAGQLAISIENAQLFSNLRKTLQELKQAQDQIIQVEKLRAIGELASGVAHDFNNVLAVILGNIQLLLFQLNDLQPEEIRDQLKIIEKASKDGAETVRRIQEFTGMKREKEFRSLSLNDIVSEVVTVTQPRWRDQAQQKGKQIEVSKRLGDIPSILGNPSELREVLTNIIFNAVDAMPKGGQITISTEPQTEDWVEVRVTDNGVGMTEDVRKRVFDPFFTTKGVGSSGLGMSVSYGIVKRHGGEILVESEAERGSTFIIHLPIGYEEIGPEESVPRIIREARSARILLIDDEESVRDILSRILRTKGHQVVVAADGEEGIEQFKQDQFDLVLTDLGLPKTSGWEVGRIVKGINPRVPVAMITGWGMELNREKMKENGIDLIISKPFNFDTVTQLVSEAMEKREKM